MNDTVAMERANPPASEPQVPEDPLRPIVEEYAQRLAEGDSPDPYELLVLHLPLARELEERLTLVEKLRGCAVVGGSGSRSEPQPREIESLVGCAALSPPSPSPEYPRTIGRYQIRQRLGAGWSAVVYRAWDPKLQREVALKVLKEEVSRDRLTALRFAREAPIVARLRHQHIVPLHESGEAGCLRYLDTELVAGQTLQERLACNPPFDFRQSAQIVAKLADALHLAHEQGVVHRDVKPSNVLIDEQGEPQLTDFGLASCSGAFESLTVEGQLIGTPAYMSPEQVAGERAVVDRRCDVYGLGVVLYRLLTDRLPFEPGDSYAQLVYRIAHEAPPRPHAVRPAIPKVLEAICLKALEKAPADRFATAAEFGDELRRWLRDEPSRLQRPTLLQTAARWARRNRALAWTGGVASIIVALALAVAAWARWQQGVHAQAEAYAQLVTLQDAARQRLRQPTQHRRSEALELLQRAARQRPLVAKGPQAARLDIEQRSLVAGWLATPDFPIAQTAELEGVWHRTWPVAIHPSGRSLAIGTSKRPLVWQRGEELRLPADLAQPLPGGRVEFSSDGRLLFHAPDDGGLVAWDEQATQISGRWQPEALSPVLAFGFPPGGQQVVVCCTSGQVIALGLPNLSEGKLWPIPPNDAPVTAAAFDYTADRVARGDELGRVQIDAADGQPLAEIAADSTQIQSLAFSPAERQIATGAKSGVARVWDVDSEQAASVPFYLGIAGVGCVQFTTDGRWLLASQRVSPTKVWDLATGRLVMSGPGTASSRLANDGRTLAVGTSKEVFFCELSPSTVVRELSGHERTVQQVVWSADSRRLATIDSGFQVHVWGLDSFVPRFSARVRAEALYAHRSNAALALSADGRLLALASGGEKISHLALHDCHSGAVLWSGSLPGGYEHLAATGGDDFLLAREEHDAGGVTLQTVLYRWQAGHPPQRWKILRLGKSGERKFFDAELTPDGRQFIWSGPREPEGVHRVEIWNVESGQVQRFVRAGVERAQETNFSATADAQLLHVASGIGQRHLYDLRRGVIQPVASAPFAMSGDGRWRLQLGQIAGDCDLFHERELHTPWLRFSSRNDDPLSLSEGVAFSPDGRFFAWGHERGTVRVADLLELERQLTALADR